MNTTETTETTITPRFEISEQSMRNALAIIRALLPEAECEFQIHISQQPVRPLLKFEEAETEAYKAALFQPKFSLVASIRPYKCETIYSFADLTDGFDFERFMDSVRKKLPSQQHIERIKRAAELRKEADALERDLSEAVG